MNYVASEWDTKRAAMYGVVLGATYSALASGFLFREEAAVLSKLLGRIVGGAVGGFILLTLIAWMRNLIYRHVWIDAIEGAGLLTGFIGGLLTFFLAWVYIFHWVGFWVALILGWIPAAFLAWLSFRAIQALWPVALIFGALSAIAIVTKN
jgi:hypothetical protein